MHIPGAEVRMVQRCGSTNTVLLEERDPGEQPVVLIAREQTAGRGRRGRRWRSAGADASLTFSLRRSVTRPLRELGALSLVAGVAATRALRALGVSRAALKWPNDLMVEGAKLGGILVETRPAGRATRAVIGIGINLRDGAGLTARLRRRVASLDMLVSPLPSAEAVAGSIVRELLDALRAFDAAGLEAVRSDWEAMDAHAGQRLRVRLADGRCISGIASGLAADGGLRLRTRAGVRAVTSGRVVSARAA
jgi:BirA family biotin operon repressor/biotin-[acetyl-CoA-carboxylase] ligase